MINFGVYTSKYCIVFFARKKDLATKLFGHFLFFSSAHLNAKSTISESDGGGLYRNVDMFCKAIGGG